jgi:hypothetical protein
MVLKLFPLKVTSIGSRKVFKSSFRPGVTGLSAAEIATEARKKDEMSKKSLSSGLVVMR